MAVPGCLKKVGKHSCRWVREEKEKRTLAAETRRFNNGKTMTGVKDVSLGGKVGTRCVLSPFPDSTSYFYFSSTHHLRLTLSGCLTIFKQQQQQKQWH